MCRFIQYIVLYASFCAPYNYSIKTYTSLKKYSETGEWEHEKIVLEPKNKDYKSISIDNVDCNEFKVIGEFIGIIKP